MLLETGSPLVAAATAGQSFDGIRKLLAQDPSNRLWQEIAIKAANTRTEALMMSGDWAAARGANAWAVDNANRLVVRDQTVTDWRTDCLLPARWMQIAISREAGDPAAARAEIAGFGRDFAWSATGKATDDERFAWVMVDLMDGTDWRSAGDASKAQAGFARAASRLPANNLTDARLLAVAAWLNRFQRVSGLPPVAPAMAGRVRYDVGALLGNRKG